MAVSHPKRCRQIASPVRAAIRAKTVDTRMRARALQSIDRVRNARAAARARYVSGSVLESVLLVVARVTPGRGAEAHGRLLALGLIRPHLATDPARGAGRVGDP